MKNTPWIFGQESIKHVEHVLFEDITEKTEVLPKGVIMRARGRFHHVGIVTSNGTVYQLKTYQREAKRLNEEIATGKIMMLDGHPDLREDDSIIPPRPGRDGVGGLHELDILPDAKFSQVAEAYGTADISDTTSGKNIANLIRSGVKVPISSRARGTANEVVLTDKHPLAEANPTWVGKKVKIINEDLHMKSYDFVDTASSGGSEIRDFREGQEEEMDLEKVLKAMKEDKEFRAKVLEAALDSDEAKAKIGESVKTEVEKAKGELKKGQAEMVKEAVQEIVKSEGFADQYGEELETVKCVHCEAENAKECKFCSGCGRAIFEGAEKPADKDAKDVAMEELKTSLESLTAKLDKLTGKQTKTETEVTVGKKLDALLEGKQKVIANFVRESLKGNSLTEDNVDEKVKNSVALIESTMAIMGVKKDELPSGVEHPDPEALDADGKKKKEGEGKEGELTESQRAEQERMLR